MNTFAAELGPQLHRHDALFRVQGREKVFLRQEIKRELDQEAANFLQFSAGMAGVLSGQAGAGHVLFQDLIIQHCVRG